MTLTPYVYGLWVLGFTFPAALFLLKASFRKPLLLLGFLILPTGVFQKFFVSDYWKPASLFNLNSRIGLDLESFVFCFFAPIFAFAIYLLFRDDEWDFPPSRASWIRILLILFIAVFGFMNAITILEFNSKEAALLGTLLGVVVSFRILKPRWKAFIPATFIFGSWYLGLLICLNYFFPLYFTDHLINPVAMGPFGIPTCEIVFAYAAGAFYILLGEAIISSPILRQMRPLTST